MSYKNGLYGKTEDGKLKEKKTLNSKPAGFGQNDFKFQSDYSLVNFVNKRPDKYSGKSYEQQIISVYTQSTGSKVQFFDCDFHLVENNDEFNIERQICAHCDCNNNRNNGCREIHFKAMREASEQGKPVIYQCKHALAFWVCPVYRDGCFYGIFRGSGYVLEEDKEALLAACNGAVPEKKFIENISSFPMADHEKINSLAEILLLCAEELSSGNEYKQLRLLSEQQICLSSLVEELRKNYPDNSEPPVYPFSLERQLITSVCHGETNEAKKLLNEIFAVLMFNSRDQFKYLQFKSLELAVLLTRTEINSSMGLTIEYNALFLKRIREANTPEEIACILHNLIEDITGRINSFQGIAHASAMRKAELYIRENLNRKMTLNEIAKVAGLSAPYFSSIFKNEMGENLSVYINRLRVEKASYLLRKTKLSLSEISGECCFEDQSWFSRIFKAYTGISPGKYRSQSMEFIP